MQKYLFLKKKKVLSSGMVPAEHVCNHAFIPQEGAVALFWGKLSTIFHQTVKDKRVCQVSKVFIFKSQRFLLLLYPK